MEVKILLPLFYRKLTTFSLLSLFSSSANDEKQILSSEYDDNDSGIQSADSKSSSAILSKGIIKGIDRNVLDTGIKSDWKSILVTSFLCFCVVVQSSLYIASMWPFLKTIDSTVTERFYGYVIAAQSLGEMLGSPIVGYLSNRCRQIRYLLYICTSLMLAGNVMYFSVELSTPALRKYLLLVARFMVGLGCSSTCLLQAYVSTASIPEDRSRALSILTTGIALAGVFGPAFQLLFTPLGYPGWKIFAWQINMYTAPAFIGSIINVIGVLSVYLFFQEKYAGIIQEQKTFTLPYSRQMLPNYNRLAAFLCHFTRFTKFFIISCLESIGTSFAAMMFSWSNAEVIENMASAEAIMNILSLLTYFSYILFRLDKIMNFRLNCIICLFSYFAFYSVTYSFPFLPNRIMTYNETAVNQTDKIGCNSGKFSWCGSINSINPTLFFTCYILFFGAGFASMNVALNTLFSKIIGPRKQGTHQGFLQMSGGIARMIGPVIITSLYTSYGPRMVWDLELSVITVTILLWIILYNFRTFKAAVKRIYDMLMRDFDGRNGSHDVSQNMSAPELPQKWHERFMKKATSFRDYLSTSVCTCIASVPTFALIVVALVLVMMLIASVPLAFAYSYMNADGSVNVANVPKTAISPIRDIQTPQVNSIQPVPVMWYRSSSLVPQNISLCKGFGFTCADQPSHVIGTYQRCDGVEDCRDGSDEMECNECGTTLSCSSKVDPSKKRCLRGEDLCDGTEHCFDGEDEKVYCNDACDPGMTKCNNANVCYSDEMKCDGDKHCPDGDDEANCSDCKNDAILCALTSECIPKWNLCDGKADCPDKSDEKNCNCKGCSGSGKVLCEGSQKVCIEKSKVCDGNNDCSDGEDEAGCPGTCNSISKSDKSRNDASRAAINLKAISCDGINYDWRYGCGGGFTACEGYCKECYTQSAFDCSAFGNSTRCIHRSLVCNGVDDCGNGRDEANCDCSAIHMTMCSSKTFNGDTNCFNSSQKCDGYSDCPGGEDENDCDKCVNNSFYCAKDKKCVPSTSRCDGVSDCSDQADEMNCTCEECNSHPFKTYMCASGSRCYRLDNVCSPYSQCPNADERDKFYCAVRLGSGYDYL